MSTYIQVAPMCFHGMPTMPLPKGQYADSSVEQVVASTQAADSCHDGVRDHIHDLVRDTNTVM